MKLNALSIVFPGGTNSWELMDVRPIHNSEIVLAACGIYTIELNL